MERLSRNIAKNAERLSGRMNTGANNDENNVSRYIIVLISKYRYSIAATSILRAYLVSELGAAKRIAIKEDGTVFNDRFIDRI